ncbi:hypothetical protein ACOME3_003735 [Neoechinorhynchus agilis]
MSEPPTTNGAPQRAESRDSLFDKIRRIAIQLAITYLVMRMFRPQPDRIVQPSDAGSNLLQNLYVPRRTVFDMFVFVSDEETLAPGIEPFWIQRQIRYADYSQGKDGSFKKSGKVKLSEHVQNNGSFYVHACFTESGNPFDRQSAFCQTKQLNKYRRRSYHQTKNLLTGQTDHDQEYQRKAELQVVEILSFFHPNMTINIIDDQTQWSASKLAPPFDRYVKLASKTTYFPMIRERLISSWCLPPKSRIAADLCGTRDHRLSAHDLNDYWNLNSEYFELNETVKEVDLNLIFAPLRLWKLQLYLSQEVKPMWSSVLSAGGEDVDLDGQDLIKQSLLETNIYILVLTVIVSIAHTFFEFLAFKNDIQFWRNKTDLQGLSVRSMLFNIFSSLIVMLYVFDNQSNFGIRISAFLGFLLEIWKVPKCLNVKVDRRQGLFPYSVKVSFTSSYVDSSTSEYDKTAFKYLSVVLFPLVCSYAIYSLIYNEHRGWYSWLLSMIYGFLLTFGFIMMTPQLFINYKLKSVAHLPWRMMTYKALNTFVDDIFAFVVKTPILYRISCFRDDIVFFIYLYQMWIYKVDFTRVNEFGLVGDRRIEDVEAQGQINAEHEKKE